jgi:hypothetical protein
MENQEVTPEIVKELYKKLSNKHLFLCVFGTTKFNLVSNHLLIKMYNYLIRNVNEKTN